jgi:hypothetical protein
MSNEHDCPMDRSRPMYYVPVTMGAHFLGDDQIVTALEQIFQSSTPEYLIIREL